MSDRISSSAVVRAAGFDPAAQPVIQCAPLPGLPGECLRLDYIRDAFQRPVRWQVEPLFTDSFSPRVFDLSGLSGAPDLPGGPGSSGAPGLSGGAGSSGVPGGAGSSSATGLSGGPGAPGFSGGSGPSGAPGPSSVPGSFGASGVSGFPGSSATSGLSGTSGPSGTSGLSDAPSSSAAFGIRGTPGSLGTAAVGAPGSSSTLDLSSGPSLLGARQAAVLMPLVQREQGLHVVFTRRAEHLHDHAGQISFPGGRIEAGDRDPIAAALRETREEIGIDGQFVRVIGVQPSFLTSTRFVMTPIIGELLPGFTIQSDGREVAEVFEVPLRVLMDPAQHRLHEVRLPGGGVRCYFSITWQSYFIWGATAVLIRNFYHYLAAARLGE